MSLLTYSELIKLPTYEERLRYLKQNSAIGEERFGFDRVLNQDFYRSTLWRSIRDAIIFRDDGCDLGIDDLPIRGNIIIHHMNPVEPIDLKSGNFELLTNPEYLICVSHVTHNAIHFGRDVPKEEKPIERKKDDTCPWK